MYVKRLFFKNRLSYLWCPQTFRYFWSSVYFWTPLLFLKHNWRKCIKKDLLFRWKFYYINKCNWRYSYSPQKSKRTFSDGNDPIYCYGYCHFWLSFIWSKFSVSFYSRKINIFVINRSLKESLNGTLKIIIMKKFGVELKAFLQQFEEVMEVVTQATSAFGKLLFIPPTTSNQPI